MRFTGNIDAKADVKGRLFLPAVFRKVLQTAGEDSLILRQDVFQHCLVLYPLSVWNEQVDALAARTSMFDRHGRELLRRFVAGAEAVSLDSNGRFLVPKRYLIQTGIAQDVRFIGVDNTIEIWSREAAEGLLAETPDFGDSLEMLMGGPTCNERKTDNLPD